MGAFNKLTANFQGRNRLYNSSPTHLIINTFILKAAYGPVLRGTLSRKRYAQRRQVTAWAIATLARRLLTIWVSEALRPIVTPKG